MQKITFYAMGSHMSTFVDNDQSEAAEMLAQVPEWFEAWEQRLSRFRPDSELNQLNQSAGNGKLIKVTQTVWDVLQEALQAAQNSSGLVTPAILNELENAGYDRDFDQLINGTNRPDPSLLSNSPVLDEIEWDEETHAVRLPAGLRLDFGGIAKGWAAHQAAQKLAHLGPTLVNAGGDIAITAPPKTQAFWPVGVDDPHLPGSTLATLKIASGGIATSGRDFRRWQKNGLWQHHIIDPRRGLPAETDILSATIVAPTVITAETAAKMFLILGSDHALTWLNANPEMTGLLVLENGNLLTSTGFSAHLWS